VRIDEQAFARVADLIARDLTATLGWKPSMAQAEARDALGNQAASLPTRLAWEDLAPATQRDVLGEVVVAAVEQLQQFVHDTFVDTSWPPCLRHPTHPMWPGEGDGGGMVWWCAREQAALAPLGGPAWHRAAAWRAALNDRGLPRYQTAGGAAQPATA